MPLEIKYSGYYRNGLKLDLIDTPKSNSKFAFPFLH